MQNRLESMDINSAIVESPSRLPVEIVSDFLQTNKNYFDNIEKASEVLRRKVGLDNGHNIGSGLKLTNYLKSNYDIEVDIILASEELKSVRKFDKKNKKLQLSEMLTYTSRNFHLAYQMG